MQHLTKQECLDMLMFDEEIPDNAIFTCITLTMDSTMRIEYTYFDETGREVNGIQTLRRKMLKTNDGIITTG